MKLLTKKSPHMTTWEQHVGTALEALDYEAVALPDPTPAFRHWGDELMDNADKMGLLIELRAAVAKDRGDEFYESIEFIAHKVARKVFASKGLEIKADEEGYSIGVAFLTNVILDEIDRLWPLYLHYMAHAKDASKETKQIDKQVLARDIAEACETWQQQERWFEKYHEAFLQHNQLTQNGDNYDF